jgi:hypothetical protein
MEEGGGQDAHKLGKLETKIIRRAGATTSKGACRKLKKFW